MVSILREEETMLNGLMKLVVDVSEPSLDSYLVQMYHETSFLHDLIQDINNYLSNRAVINYLYDNYNDKLCEK